MLFLIFLVKKTYFSIFNNGNKYKINKTLEEGFQHIVNCQTKLLVFSVICVITLILLFPLIFVFKETAYDVLVTQRLWPVGPAPVCGNAWSLAWLFSYFIFILGFSSFLRSCLCSFDTGHTNCHQNQKSGNLPS